MLKSIAALALCLSLFGAVRPALANEEVTEPAENSNTAGDWLYYCQAQSWASGLWYYWYAYNPYVARANALAACQAQNGYTCNVACRLAD
jgi:hypothetical protein